MGLLDIFVSINEGVKRILISIEFLPQKANQQDIFFWVSTGECKYLKMSGK